MEVDVYLVQNEKQIVVNQNISGARTIFLFFVYAKTLNMNNKKLHKV